MARMDEDEVRSVFEGRITPLLLQPVSAHPALNVGPPST